MSMAIQPLVKWKVVIVGLFATNLSGCPLTVNLNVSADKPIPIALMVEKPIAVTLDADVAVTKLPPITNVAVTKLPPVIIRP